MFNQSFTSRWILLFVLLAATLHLAYGQSQFRLSERQSAALIKRIDRRTERFCKTYASNSKTFSVVGNPGEVNEHLEEFALLVGQLSDYRVAPRYMVDLLRSASLIERLLLREGIASRVVVEWATLHADVDLLARSYGIKWTDAVITPKLLAELDAEASRFGDLLVSELSAYQPVNAGSDDLKVAMTVFQQSLRSLNSNYHNSEGAFSQIEDLRVRARLIANYLQLHSVRFNVSEEWRSVSSQLEELGRLYQLDAYERKSARQ